MASFLQCSNPELQSFLARVKWLPPSVDCLKINFDGAIFKAEELSGIGVAIRESHGLVIALLSEKLPRAYSAEEVEVLAAARALVFAREIGVDNIILEGDSSTVIKALQGEDRSLSACGLLIEDVKLLSRSFSKWLYSHIRRESNKLAYCLARFLVSISDFEVLMEFVPSPLVAIFQVDLTGDS